MKIYAKQVLSPQLAIVRSKKAVEASKVLAKEMTALILGRWFIVLLWQPDL